MANTSHPTRKDGYLHLWYAYDDSSFKLSREHVLILKSFLSFLFISPTIINYGYYSLQVTTTTTSRSGTKGPMMPVLTQTREEKKRSEKRDRVGKGDDWGMGGR
jgi:hypothetical protein